MRIMAVAMSAVGLLCACADRPRTTPAGSPESPAQISPIELDHVLVFAPLDSPEAEVVQALREAGLVVEEVRKEFPGGVVGRYVYFDTTYLEVLWLEPNDATDAETRRKAEWETTGASPFGVGLRRRKDTPEELPFPSRAYVAEWLRPGTEMRFLTEEAETLAPSMFVVPRYMAFTSWGAERAAEATQTLDHELGVRQLTGVCITTLPAGYPRLDGVLADTSVLVERGDAPLMEIILDNGRQEKRRDLRPVLPLVFSY